MVATWLDSLADAFPQLVPDACEDYGRTVPYSLSALEAALAELMDLLDGPSRPESYYQNWFEEHPVVFEALGYEEFSRNQFSDETAGRTSNQISYAVGPADCGKSSN